MPSLNDYFDKIDVGSIVRIVDSPSCLDMIIAVIKLRGPKVTLEVSAYESYITSILVISKEPCHMYNVFIVGKTSTINTLYNFTEIEILA